MRAREGEKEGGRAKGEISQTCIYCTSYTQRPQ